MDKPTATPNPPPQTAAPHPRPDRLTVILRWVVGVLAAALILAGGWVGFAYAFSPAAIRHPQRTHFHFRLQIINGGTPVNFADSKFQTPFDTDICNADLTKQPIHFHDRLDQFVHIHWAGITGGLLLKNYGWNFITGADDTLGYRFDKFPSLTRVPIHGQALPKPPAGAKYYVYIVSDQGYKERDWNDFLKQDLRDFFAGKPSTATSGSLLDRLVPAASAHGDEAAAAGATEEQLAKLNDVVGSVIIFVQKDRPTEAQIQDRFNHLVPLPESTCAG
jgi:hypothetical protein